ncbi:MAG: RdgB/HAM1 family non-canonical purine NTP pyrophosphatase [Bryobacterales bacterium]|nr:RdgB/HAM1 family non-canonical purine NTP pyrophosphatase [Bryobacteraceae bacterium]MDW8353627.1 RdgB/HAM1 family non-canonical purine NTP pyrophosphatase [Bryobacterales bacterium]
MTVYCATTNPGKLREFRRAAEQFALGRLDLLPLPGLEALPRCPETGRSFEENAIQKALHYSSLVSGLILADDSGLVVPALDGRPGVLSARFAGPNATDEDNNRLLLEQLSGVSDRAASFVCVVALAKAGRLIGTFDGEVSGVIAHEPRGANGFGYDPLFVYPPLGATFAELAPEQKLAVSHRGAAARKAIAFLLAEEFRLTG